MFDMPHIKTFRNLKSFLNVSSISGTLNIAHLFEKNAGYDYLFMRVHM